MKPTIEKQSLLMRACAITALLALLTAAGAGPLHSKSTTWTHGSSSDLWSNPGNWSNGVPEDNDDVLFGAIGGSSRLDISVTLNSLDMTGYSGTFDATGATLQVSANAILSGSCDFGNGSIMVGGDLALMGFLFANSALISVVGGLDVLDYGYLWGDSGSFVDIGADITGSPTAIIQMGAGSLRVSGDAMLSDFLEVQWSPGGRFICAGSDSVQTILLDPLKTTIRNLVVEGNRTELHSTGDTLQIHETLRVIFGTLEPAEGNLVVQDTAAIETNGRLETRNGGGDVSFMGPVIVKGALSYTKEAGAIRFMPFGLGGFVVDIRDGGFFEAAGTPAGRIYLGLSTDLSPGSQWRLVYDESSTIHVDYVEMHDAKAMGPALNIPAASNSIDGGNNLNWYFGTVSETEAPPLRLALEAAPNPFNPATTLRYEIPRAGEVTIRIYDVAGRLVRSLVSEHRAAGSYQESWDGRNGAGRLLGSGAYFCRMESNGEAKVQKLLLLR